MLYPSFAEMKEIVKSDQYKTAPVTLEMLSDIKTPMEVLRIMQNVSEQCYMLESVGDNQQWGRYTFLGYDPKLEISCMDGKMKVGTRNFDTDDPGQYIKQVLDDHRSIKLSNMPPFTGGLVGYFSYDYIKYVEPTLDLDAHNSEGFKDVNLMLFDKVIAYDHYRQKIVLIATILLDNYEMEYHRAGLELKQMADLIKHGIPKKDEPGKIKSEIRQLFDEETFCNMVNRAKHHIYEGDIFQIVLSNRLEAKYEGSLLNTYRVLRTVNPSPYMFYFSSPDMEVAGASPETLIKLDNGVLHTFPLAGTRPRGKTEEEDKALEKELLSDEKELAEHNMLVDLGRNDIGKISKFGSVELEAYHTIHRYSHVMHIGSTVKGVLSEDKSPLDAIDAILPAGTLSGAPKIKACQIINDLEQDKRGIYGGAFGYLDFTGNLDVCIGIRLVYKKNGTIFVRSGAGIVADSVPKKEYEETIQKAAAIMKSLKLAEEVMI